MTDAHSFTDSEGASLLASALGLDAGATPFPWQLRLLQQFSNGDVPRSLDVPTGLGKTATIAIWLLALARGAALPRRLVYIVDRRAVVDQATEVAERLRDWIEGTPGLKRIIGLENRTLPISTLRGQFVDNREWLEDPSLPAILIGTVDMIGSRLLFEGYGVSRKMRPYHAGLLGHDCLYVLDEAHLIPPFERLLERIILSARDLGGEALPASKLSAPRLLSLSATGRSKGGPGLRLCEADLDHTVASKRLRAHKSLALHDLDAESSLAEALAERAWSLASGDNPMRCILFTDKRDDAEAVAAVLREWAAPRERGTSPTADLELLVGGRRVFERIQAAETLRRLGFLAGSSAPLERPAFLVATSAGEVGVDLDADHLVCDLVAWERMIQRLGRVNRRGHGRATVDVYCPPLDRNEEQEQFDRLEAVRGLISRLPASDGERRDVSPGALLELQVAASGSPELANLVECASTRPPLYPALTRATLDAWSMTSLARNAGRPRVAPWLRGWAEAKPQTTVIWRSFIPENPSDLSSFFEAAPPHTSEKLELESYRVQAWLAQRAKRLAKVRGTSEGVDAHRFVAVALLSEDEVEGFTASGLQAALRDRTRKRFFEGITLVLSRDFAGLGRDGLFDASEDEAPMTADGEEWLAPASGLAPVVRFRVRRTNDPDSCRDGAWRERARFATEHEGDGEDICEWIVVDKWRHDASTEEDRSSGYPQLLDEHQSWAAERAMRLAKRLGLSEEGTSVLCIAARLHDEGKRAERWQRAFHASSDGIYAKTRGPLSLALLDGYRHEFGSLPVAERDVELLALSPAAQDLVLHLIASHHGHARPSIRVDGGLEAPSRLEERARRVALRFAKLQKHWGPWGLAWWEALLRAADQQASRDNDRRGSDRSGGRGR